MSRHLYAITVTVDPAEDYEPDHAVINVGADCEAVDDDPAALGHPTKVGVSAAVATVGAPGNERRMLGNGDTFNPATDCRNRLTAVPAT
ncbi:MAG: hypothetical protein NVS3B26_22910 [Mycobacteriales bacterium]